MSENYESRSRATMTEEQLIQAVVRLGRMGVKGVIFSGGGEPFVNKHTAKATAYAKSTGMDVGVITNGALLTTSDMEMLLENTKWVRFSIDASNRELYKTIRGKDDFDTVFDNVSNMYKMRDAMNSDTTIGVQMVVNKKNLGDIPKFYRKFKDIADYIQYRPLEGYDKHDNTISAMSEMMLETVAKKDKVIISDRYQNEDAKKPLCRGYGFIGAVDAKGDFHICCHMVGRKDMVYGNVFNMDDWNGNSWKFRRYLCYKKINYGNCPNLCRGWGINTYLKELDTGKHRGFL
jgi:MoaA/NifB/PqqE/SkfB family radical SAM enzyme